MKPEVSAGCHQTLSLVGGVWGRDYRGAGIENSERAYSQDYEY